MKARTLILTAGMAVALVALAAQPAAAMLPTDGGASAGLLGGKLQLVASKAGVKKASATTIKASAYSKYAYVQGGASARVAKAKELKVSLRPFGTQIAGAEYFAEEVRRQLEAMYGKEGLYGRTERTGGSEHGVVRHIHVGIACGDVRYQGFAARRGGASKRRADASFDRAHLSLTPR